MNYTSWSRIALAGYLVGLALAFGVRTWMHWRATGTTGFRGISGRPGSLGWWGGVLFPIALVTGLVSPMLVIAGISEPVVLPGHRVIACLGALLALAGLGLVLVAQHAMGASWRIGVADTERTALVIGGVFSRIRNPIFTGMTTVAVGELLMVPTPLSVVSVACLVAALEIQVRVVEEPYLYRLHSQAYCDYTARTGRFLPPLAARRNNSAVNGGA
jgi:protein-S-isoprenylcysteine O-methyltransferase Ste14